MAFRSARPAHRLLFKALVLLVFPIVTTPTAKAQEAPQPSPGLELEPVTVTATRIPTPESEVGSSVTVITAQDIAAKQERTLPDVLNDVPGLNLVQTGSPGGITYVYMRGANSNQTKVLIDGIDVSDPSSPDGSFDFSQLLASDIAQVEVLRGPASGLYGADAIGGVINIITKTGSGPPQFRGSIEGGSFDTFNQTAGVSGSVGRFSYDFDVAHFHSGDTDVTPFPVLVPGRPLNPDYDDNKAFSTKLGAQLTDTLDVGVVARYVDTDLDSTSDDDVGPEAARSYSDNHELFTRAFAHLVSFGGAFEQTLGVGFTGYWRHFFDPNPFDVALGDDPADYHGYRTKLDWQGKIKLMPGEMLVLGAEHELDRLTNTNPASAHYTNDAGYAELQSSIGERIFNAASLRYDDNSAFGGHPTFREAPAYLIGETDTKLKGSVGTGFKPPTLDELYDNYPQFDFFANPNLKPETSFGYDLGFEQLVWRRQIEFGSTYFRNDFTNLIEINPEGTSYENIGKATAYGAENFVSYQPWQGLTLRLDYTYTLANDDITHTELLRRPKHKVSLNAKWQATDKLSFTATAVYKGKWVDINRDGTETGLFATPYSLVNLTSAYDLGHGVSLFARIDNLLNRHYQDPIGFDHQGLGVFTGFRFAFDVPQTLPALR
jgi:vitamin B12 transporter